MMFEPFLFNITNIWEIYRKISCLGLFRISVVEEYHYDISLSNLRIPRCFPLLGLGAPCLNAYVSPGAGNFQVLITEKVGIK